jgi:seryl-tRNA synthetase
MLQVQFIKDNQKKVLDGLAKRNFANANTIIDAVLKQTKKEEKLKYC